MNPILPPDPDHPIAAVTHPNPYPHYARLARERPFAFEPRLNLWVAAGPEAVHACLSDPRLQVRPVAEPVPAAFKGTPLGAVFAAWARMRDGHAHTGPRRMVEQVMADSLEDLAQTVARSLCPAPMSATALNSYQFALPVQVLARHVGVVPEHLEQTQAMIERVVTALGPNATAAVVTDAGIALEQALPWFPSEGRQAGAELGTHERIANLLGLVFQAHTATAGLLGNALVHVGRRPDQVRAILAEARAARTVVAHVARHDPAVHNTRRFAAEPVTIAGQDLPVGSQILVVLAGASPEAGLPCGHGPHTCPGSQAAHAIAAAGLTAIVRSGMDLGRLTFDYLPLPNARVPYWSEARALAAHPVGRDL